MNLLGLRIRFVPAPWIRRLLDRRNPTEDATMKTQLTINTDAGNTTQKGRQVTLEEARDQVLANIANLYATYSDARLGDIEEQLFRTKTIRTAMGADSQEKLAEIPEGIPDDIRGAAPTEVLHIIAQFPGELRDTFYDKIRNCEPITKQDLINAVKSYRPKGN